MSRERQIIIAGCEEPEDPTASFRTVLIDPPWPEVGGGGRGCQNHYEPILTKAEHLSTIVRSSEWPRIASSAHLYMWATSNYESWAHWLIDALGFKHFVSLPWVKPGLAGLGQYWRGAHEPLMFATRGRGFDVRTETRSLRSDCLVGAPRPTSGRLHSAKPVRAFEVIEERSMGPYLEMYARGEPFSDAWAVWGDQAKAPDEAQDAVPA